MTTNVANLDRAIRVWLGMMLLASPLLELDTFPYSLLGLIPLITGLMGFSPLYRLFGRPSQQKPKTRVVALPPASRREFVRRAA